MKVTEKKLDDGRILLEAVASTAEVSHALTAAQYRFAQQMGVQPTPGMSVEQAVEKQLGIKDLDAIVQQQAVEYLVPFAIDKRNITPAFPALPKAAGPLKRGQTFSFEVRVTPKPDYELKFYEPVFITVPPFEIEQAEVEEQIAQIAESYAEFVSDEPHPVEKATASCWRSKPSRTARRWTTCPPKAARTSPAWASCPRTSRSISSA